jgi:general stress protein 26
MLAEKPCKAGTWTKTTIHSTVASSLREKGLVNVGMNGDGELYMISKEGRVALRKELD